MKTGIFRSVMALVSLLLLSGTTVVAQAVPAPGGITVQGEGSASAPADLATIYITLGPEDSFGIMPVVDKIVGTSSAIDPANVIQAVVATGIASENVQVIPTAFYGEWSSDQSSDGVTLMVAVDAPSAEGISALLATVREAAHADGLLVNEFSVMYSVTDCRSLSQEARINAVADARENADDQAAAMQVTRGDIIASVDSYPMYTPAFQSNTCTGGASLSSYSMRYMASGFDENLPAEVTVVVAVQVTFAIP